MAEKSESEEEGDDWTLEWHWIGYVLLAILFVLLYRCFRVFFGFLLKLYRRTLAWANPKYGRRLALLHWIENRAEQKLYGFSEIWENPEILATVVSSVIPQSCQEDDACEISRHATLQIIQTVISRYFDIRPMFLGEELKRPWDRKVENKFIRLLHLIKASIERLERTTKQEDASEYVARGMGLITAAKGHAACFFVYSRHELDFHSMRIAIAGPSGDIGETVITSCRDEVDSYTTGIRIKYEVIANAGSSQDGVKKCLKVVYTPNHTGEYRLDISKRGYVILGSPFNITVDASCRKTKCAEAKTSPSETRVINRIVDFVNEKMLLTDKGELIKISSDSQSSSALTKLKTQMNEQSAVAISLAKILQKDATSKVKPTPAVFFEICEYIMKTCHFILQNSSNSKGLRLISGANKCISGEPLLLDDGIITEVAHTEQEMKRLLEARNTASLKQIPTLEEPVKDPDVVFIDNLLQEDIKVSSQRLERRRKFECRYDNVASPLDSYDDDVFSFDSSKSSVPKRPCSSEKFLSPDMIINRSQLTTPDIVYVNLLETEDTVNYRQFDISTKSVSGSLERIHSPEHSVTRAREFFKQNKEVKNKLVIDLETNFFKSVEESLETNERSSFSESELHSDIETFPTEYTTNVEQLRNEISRKIDEATARPSKENMCEQRHVTECKNFQPRVSFLIKQKSVEKTEEEGNEVNAVFFSSKENETIESPKVNISVRKIIHDFEKMLLAQNEQVDNILKTMLDQSGDKNLPCSKTKTESKKSIELEEQPLNSKKFDLIKSTKSSEIGECILRRPVISDDPNLSEEQKFENNKNKHTEKEDTKQTVNEVAFTDDNMITTTHTFEHQIKKRAPVRENTRDCMENHGNENFTDQWKPTGEPKLISQTFDGAITSEGSEQLENPRGQCLEILACDTIDSFQTELLQTIVAPFEDLEREKEEENRSDVRAELVQIGKTLVEALMRHPIQSDMIKSVIKRVSMDRNLSAENVQLLLSSLDEHSLANPLEEENVPSEICANAIGCSLTHASWSESLEKNFHTSEGLPKDQPSEIPSVTSYGERAFTVTSIKDYIETAPQLIKTVVNADGIIGRGEREDIEVSSKAESVITNQVVEGNLGGKGGISVDKPNICKETESQRTDFAPAISALLSDSLSTSIEHPGEVLEEKNHLVKKELSVSPVEVIPADVVECKPSPKMRALDSPFEEAYFSSDNKFEQSQDSIFHLEENENTALPLKTVTITADMLSDPPSTENLIESFSVTSPPGQIGVSNDTNTFDPPDGIDQCNQNYTFDNVIDFGDHADYTQTQLDTISKSSEFVPKRNSAPKNLSISRQSTIIMSKEELCVLGSDLEILKVKNDSSIDDTNCSEHSINEPSKEPLASISAQLSTKKKEIIQNQTTSTNQINSATEEMVTNSSTSEVNAEYQFNGSERVLDESISAPGDGKISIVSKSIDNGCIPVSLREQASYDHYKEKSLEHEERNEEVEVVAEIDSSVPNDRLNQEEIHLNARLEAYEEDQCGGLEETSCANGVSPIDTPELPDIPTEAQRQTTGIFEKESAGPLESSKRDAVDAEVSLVATLRDHEDVTGKILGIEQNDEILRTADDPMIIPVTSLNVIEETLIDASDHGDRESCNQSISVLPKPDDDELVKPSASAVDPSILAANPGLATSEALAEATHVINSDVGALLLSAPTDGTSQSSHSFHLIMTDSVKNNSVGLISTKLESENDTVSPLPSSELPEDESETSLCSTTDFANSAKLNAERVDLTHDFGPPSSTISPSGGIEGSLRSITCKLCTSQTNYDHKLTKLQDKKLMSGSKIKCKLCTGPSMVAYPSADVDTESYSKLAVEVETELNVIPPNSEAAIGSELCLLSDISADVSRSSDSFGLSQVLAENLEDSQAIETSTTSHPHIEVSQDRVLDTDENVQESSERGIPSSVEIRATPEDKVIVDLVTPPDHESKSESMDLAIKYVIEAPAYVEPLTNQGILQDLVEQIIDVSNESNASCNGGATDIATCINVSENDEEAKEFQLLLIGSNVTSDEDPGSMKLSQKIEPQLSNLTDNDAKRVEDVHDLSPENDLSEVDTIIAEGKPSVISPTNTDPPQELTETVCLNKPCPDDEQSKSEPTCDARPPTDDTRLGTFGSETEARKIDFVDPTKTVPSNEEHTEMLGDPVIETKNSSVATKTPSYSLSVPSRDFTRGPESDSDISIGNDDAKEEDKKDDICITGSNEDSADKVIRDMTLKNSTVENEEESLIDSHFEEQNIFTDQGTCTFADLIISNKPSEYLDVVSEKETLEPCEEDSSVYKAEQDIEPQKLSEKSNLRMGEINAIIDNKELEIIDQQVHVSRDSRPVPLNKTVEKDELKQFGLALTEQQEISSISATDEVAVDDTNRVEESEVSRYSPDFVMQGGGEVVNSMCSQNIKTDEIEKVDTPKDFIINSTEVECQSAKIDLYHTSVTLDLADESVVATSHSKEIESFGIDVDVSNNFNRQDSIKENDTSLCEQDSISPYELGIEDGSVQNATIERSNVENSQNCKAQEEEKNFSKTSQNEIECDKISVENCNLLVENNQLSPDSCQSADITATLGDFAPSPFDPLDGWLSNVGGECLAEYQSNSIMNDSWLDIEADKLICWSPSSDAASESCSDSIQVSKELDFESIISAPNLDVALQKLEQKINNAQKVGSNGKSDSMDDSTNIENLNTAQTIDCSAVPQFDEFSGENREEFKTSGSNEPLFDWKTINAMGPAEREIWGLTELKPQALVEDNSSLSIPRCTKVSRPNSPVMDTISEALEEQEDELLAIPKPLPRKFKADELPIITLTPEQSVDVFIEDPDLDESKLLPLDDSKFREDLKILSVLDFMNLNAETVPTCYTENFIADGNETLDSVISTDSHEADSYAPKSEETIICHSENNTNEAHESFDSCLKCGHSTGFCICAGLEDQPDERRGSTPSVVLPSFEDIINNESQILDDGISGGDSEKFAENFGTTPSEVSDTPELSSVQLKCPTETNTMELQNQTQQEYLKAMYVNKCFPVDKEGDNKIEFHEVTVSRPSSLSEKKSSENKNTFPSFDFQGIKHAFETSENLSSPETQKLTLLEEIQSIGKRGLEQRIRQFNEGDSIRKSNVESSRKLDFVKEEKRNRQALASPGELSSQEELRMDSQNAGSKTNIIKEEKDKINEHIAAQDRDARNNLVAFWKTYWDKIVEESQMNSNSPLSSVGNKLSAKELKTTLPWPIKRFELSTVKEDAVIEEEEEGEEGEETRDTYLEKESVAEPTVNKLNIIDKIRLFENIVSTINLDRINRPAHAHDVSTPDLSEKISETTEGGVIGCEDQDVRSKPADDGDAQETNRRKFELQRNKSFQNRFLKAREFFELLEKHSLNREAEPVSKDILPSTLEETFLCCLENKSRIEYRKRRRRRKSSRRQLEKGIIHSAPTSDSETPSHQAYQMWGSERIGQRVAERIHIKDLFEDVFNETDRTGLFRGGVPNRKAVLASLRSIDLSQEKGLEIIPPDDEDEIMNRELFLNLVETDNISNVPRGYQSVYPYLPTTPINQYRSRPSVEHNLIPRNTLLQILDEN